MKPTPTKKAKVAEQTSPVTDSSIPGKSAGMNKLFPYLINFWVFIPVVIYFSLVNKYAVNFPYQDDYNAILEFLTKFKLATGFDKLSLLVSQHGDHRILHSRIVYVLYNGIFGKVNFRNLIFLGNLQLVIIFLFLIHFIKQAVPKYWNIVSVVVGFCIFDASSYENADFAMSGMQNYGVLMLFLASLYFYQKSGNKFLMLAALFEIICIFSSGNGMIGALCTTIILVLNREKIKYMVSGAIFLVCSGLYYFHYEKIPAMGVKDEPFSLIRDVRFFLHMVGSHFSYENGIPIGVCVLAVLIALLPVSLKLKFRENTLPFISILGFLMGTVLSISVFRSTQAMGELGAYSSRYLIYSHLLMGLLFIFLWVKLEGKKWVWYASAAGVVMLLYAYQSNYEYGEGCMDMTKRRLENMPYFYSDHKAEANAKAKALEEAACKLGIYCIQDER